MIKKTFPAIKLCILCTAVSTAVSAHEYDLSRPDAHAPIGVMGDHTHKENEFMISYRLMTMTMDGMQNGRDKLSDQDVYNRGYHMTPTHMDMTMHMLGGMYASSDHITWMTMIPYLKNDMDMNAHMGGKSSMESSGFGDVKIGGLYNIYKQNNTSLHLNLMMSMPTGSITEKNDSGDIIPYPMQLGSGTYDLHPGITYNAQFDKFSWGAQANMVVRLGENNRHYTLGDRYQLQSWAQMPFHQHASLSARVNWEKWGNIRGEDRDIMTMKTMTPLADPANQGGRTPAGWPRYKYRFTRA